MSSRLYLGLACTALMLLVLALGGLAFYLLFQTHRLEGELAESQQQRQQTTEQAGACQARLGTLQATTAMQEASIAQLRQAGEAQQQQAARAQQQATQARQTTRTRVAEVRVAQVPEPCTAALVWAAARGRLFGREWEQ